MAQEIQPLERKVQLDGTVGQAPFSKAFNEAAMTPTMLGQIGSQIAQASGNKLAEIRGYEAGLNPKGNLFPAITQADKHFEAAYLAQSKNTLSLNLNSMMSSAQEEIGKAYELTPEMIGEYRSKMGQGIAETLKDAPTEVKSELGMQYVSALQGNVTNLNLKVIEQNQKKAIDYMNLAGKQTNSQILDLATTGNIVSAKKAYEGILVQNQLQFDSKMMTATGKYTADVEAKISLYSGMFTNTAIKARNVSDKALYEHLTSLSDITNKPPELTVDEYNAVTKNVMTTMNSMDSFQALERNTVKSNLEAQIYSGEMTTQTIQEASQNRSIRKSDINDLTITWAKYKAQKQGDSVAENQFTGGNFIYLTGKQKDDTYLSIVDQKQKESPDKSLRQIEQEVAVAAGGYVPAYGLRLGQLMNSQNPQEVADGYNSYAYVKQHKPENIQSLDSEIFNKISDFGTFSRLNNGNIALAVSEMRQAGVEQDPDQLKSNQGVIKRFHDTQLNTPEMQLSFANKILQPKGLSLDKSAPGTANAVSQIIQDFDRLTNRYRGNTEAAKETLRQNIDNVYGETYISGNKQTAVYPLEKYVDRERLGTFFIQNDLLNSSAPLLGKYKKAFDEGKNHFYYRIKNPEQWDLKALDGNIKKLDRIKKNMNSDNLTVSIYKKEYDELTDKIESVKDWQRPIQIEKIMRVSDEGKESEAVVETSRLIADVLPGVGTSYDPQKTIAGNYGLRIVNERGYTSQLQDIGADTNRTAFYNPHIELIRKNADSYVNASGSFERKKSHARLLHEKKMLEIEQSMDSKEFEQRSKGGFVEKTQEYLPYGEGYIPKPGFPKTISTVNGKFMVFDEVEQKRIEALYSKPEK